MIGSIRTRRPHHHRPRYGVYICAAISAFLLLLSVTLLYYRLSLSQSQSQSNRLHHPPPNSDSSLSISNPLISDDDDNLSSSTTTTKDDKIDALDDVILDNDDVTTLDDETENDESHSENLSSSKSGFFFDHVTGGIRRRVNKRRIEDWDEEYGGFIVTSAERRMSVIAAIGSDDAPVEMEIRRRMTTVSGVEDALMVKVGKRSSPLREGWGEWFDKKSDFLRRDKMFKSNFDLLNPQHNPMLQDPDGVGVSGLTRGDKAMQKWWISHFKKVPFHSSEEKNMKKKEEVNVVRKALDKGEVRNVSSNSSDGNSSDVNLRQSSESVRSEVLELVYSDGKRWGFYPGLHPHLSFSDFMGEFFREGCELRVFMVWNSPAWMFSVRHQRGLESLLSRHRGACVVVFSETIELDFFKNSFVKDGYKVAIAMPDLDELLKGTPTHIFASAWFEWRKTKHYATHYSELIRLAALYKYGGIYLDSDIIVLKPLSSLSNCVGKEDRVVGGPLNGAVMAFKKNR